MLDFVIYLFACCGLTTAITKLYIGRSVREFISGVDDERFDQQIGTKWEKQWSWRGSFFGRLIRCPACTGFWVGLLLALFLAFEAVLVASGEGWAWAYILARVTLFYSLASSAFCFAISNWLESLGAKPQK